MSGEETDTVCPQVDGLSPSPIPETTRTTEDPVLIDLSEPAAEPEPVQDSHNNVEEAGPSVVSPVEEVAHTKEVVDTQLQEDDEIYQIKWIGFGGRSVAVVHQNVNGPCPLLAIANLLLLRGDLTLPGCAAVISACDLLARLGETLLQRASRGEVTANSALEQSLSDCLALFPRLRTGLDMNVKFSGCTQFEFTPELEVFDRFGVELVHGWLVDPQQSDLHSFLQSLSYNQLVEKIIQAKSTEEANMAFIAEEFLDTSSHQLTVHGLCELSSSMQDNALAVLFRNNHFSTIYKHKGSLYILVTDQGYVDHFNIVWEALVNVENDGHFVDSDFARSSVSQAVVSGAVSSIPEQVNSDHQLAMALQRESDAVGQAAADETDEQLAWRLQQEEAQAAEQMQQHSPPRQQQPSRQPVRAAPPPRRRGQSESSCNLL